MNNFTTNWEENSTVPVPGGNEPLAFIDYLALMEDMSKEDKRFKQDLAKKNYLNIHQKRRKR